MLQPKLYRHSIEKALDRFFLADATGNHGDLYYVEKADGTKEQKSNDWGYGGPNPLRSSLALIYVAVHKAAKEHGGERFILPESYNPVDATVEKVAFPYQKDGYHRYYQFALPIYNEQGVYNTDEAVFFAGSTKVPYMGEIKQKQADGSWKVIDAQELVALYETVTYKSLLDDVLWAKAWNYLGKVSNERRNTIVNLKRCDDDDYSFRREWELHFLLREIETAECSRHYTLAEKYLNAVEHLKN